MSGKLPESRGDQYRQRAERIRDMARNSETEAARREFEVIVQLYEKLAREHDRADRPA